MRVLPVVAVLGVTACLPDLGDSEVGSWGRSGSGEESGSSIERSSTDTTAVSGPQLGPTTRAHPAPPPLSGGTLAVVPGRTMIVAADPDRDAVHVIDLEKATVSTVKLSAGDEPGRVVVDHSLRAHVALRSGRALATIDLAAGNALTKREVCNLPRGVAWDADTDDVHVACADGELVTLAAAGGAPKRVVHVARDLRDVVVTPQGLVVSTFRDAHVIRLAKDGSVQAQSVGLRGGVVSRVAWRMIPAPQTASSEDPGETVMMAAQRTPSSFDIPPPTPPAYYESEDGCAAGGPLTVVADRRKPLVVPNAVLPIDLATDGTEVVVVSAGNAYHPDKPQLVHFPLDVVSTTCWQGYEVELPGTEITSIAYEPIRARWYALSREPAALHRIDMWRHRPVETFPLSTASVKDTGHALFHASSGRGATACASCHPEGRDDGHSWKSVQLGARRTPSLLGTIAGTAPYHWNGEASGLDDVMSMTFTQRMRGPKLENDQKAAVASWLSELPALPRRTASVTIASLAVTGRTIFDSPSAKCSSCHSGAMLTNNATVDVGTGGPLQVPSLAGVVHRAPYLHDGSRPHLRSVLYTPHGGATVRDDEIDALVAYLESL